MALKTHRIAPFFKIFLWGHAPKPPYIATAGSDMPLGGMYTYSIYLQNPPKNYSCPPPPPREILHTPLIGGLIEIHDVQLDHTDQDVSFGCMPIPCAIDYML